MFLNIGQINVMYTVHYSVSGGGDINEYGRSLQARFAAKSVTCNFAIGVITSARSPRL